APPTPRAPPGNTADHEPPGNAAALPGHAPSRPATRPDRPAPRHARTTAATRPNCAAPRPHHRRDAAALPGASACAHIDAHISDRFVIDSSLLLQKCCSNLI